MQTNYKLLILNNMRNLRVFFTIGVLSFGLTGCSWGQAPKGNSQTQQTSSTQQSTQNIAQDNNNRWEIIDFSLYRHDRRAHLAAHPVSGEPEADIAQNDLDNNSDQSSGQGSDAPQNDFQPGIQDPRGPAYYGSSNISAAPVDPQGPGPFHGLTYVGPSVTTVAPTNVPGPFHGLTYVGNFATAAPTPVNTPGPFHGLRYAY